MAGAGAVGGVMGGEMGRGKTSILFGGGLGTVEDMHI